MSYGGKEATVGVTLDLGFALPTYYTPPYSYKELLSSL